MTSRDKKPAKPSSSRAGGIRSLSDLNRRSGPDSDSDSDGPPEYYTAEKIDIKKELLQKRNPNLESTALIMSLLQHLPHDIIIDILSRLPAKTLLKFRCVSKQWNSLIRSHKFSELHSIASNKDLISRQRVLLCALPFNFVKYDVVEKDGVVVTEDTPFSVSVADVGNVVVLGEYNGMICIMIRCDRLGGNGEKIFYLWNPSSRECREVRRADVANVVDTTCSMFDVLDVGRGGQPYNAYGFGYDSTSDDYKIVKFSRNFVEVYMVGGRIWRKIKLPDHGMFRSFRDVMMGSTCPFVNGNCHWIMKKVVSGVREIVSFDLAKEKLEEVIPLPELSKGKSVRDLNAFGGKLAVIVETPRLEIWVMDIYGVGSSWSKKVTLQEVARGSDVRPICFLRNGGVLVCVDDSTLMMYDPEKETYGGEKELRLRRKHMVVYVESLISPNHVPNADKYLGL